MGERAGVQGLRLIADATGVARLWTPCLTGPSTRHDRVDLGVARLVVGTPTTPRDMDATPAVSRARAPRSGSGVPGIRLGWGGPGRKGLGRWTVGRGRAVAGLDWRSLVSSGAAGDRDEHARARSSPLIHDQGLKVPLGPGADDVAPRPEGGGGRNRPGPLRNALRAWRYVDSAPGAMPSAQPALSARLQRAHERVIGDALRRYVARQFLPDKPHHADSGEH